MKSGGLASLRLPTPSTNYCPHMWLRTGSKTIRLQITLQLHDFHSLSIDVLTNEQHTMRFQLLNNAWINLCTDKSFVGQY